MSVAKVTDEQIKALFDGPEPHARGDGSASAATGEGDSTDEGEDELLEVVRVLQGQVRQLTDDRDSDRQNAQRDLTLRTVAQGVDNHKFLGTIKGRLKSSKAKKALDKRAYRAVVEAMETLPWGPRALNAGLKILEDELVAEQAALSGDEARCHHR